MIWMTGTGVGEGGMKKFSSSFGGSNPNIRSFSPEPVGPDGERGDGPPLGRF